MKTLLPLVLVMVSGCASASLSANPIPIDYQFSDFPVKKRVELSYQNTSETPICLYPEHWPNQAGKVDQASDRIILVVENERFPIEHFNTGYCPGCKIEVDPGEKISAFFLYKDFSLPDRLANKPKVLEFKPVGFSCR